MFFRPKAALLAINILPKPTKKELMNQLFKRHIP